MTKPETGEFLFDDLRELAASHVQQKLEFEKFIPESISLGLFVVSQSLLGFSEAMCNVQCVQVMIRDLSVSKSLEPVRQRIHKGMMHYK